MSSRNLYGLVAIVTVAWLLILVESFLFVVVIRPLGPAIHFGDVPSAALKIGATGALAAVWVAVMFAMDYLYARRRKTPT